MINLGKILGTNKNLELDLKRLVNGRTFISAMTGEGKSWTIRKIVEETFGKTGIIILDPEGEYSSLRELYPFLIIGKDIPLEVESAEFLAEQVLKENISAIFDFSTTDVIDQQEFTSRFIKKFMELQTKLKKSYLLVVEEADEFAPEKGTFKSNSLQSIINVAKKGRKRGIGLIIATQRPAFVSKMVLSQCRNKLIGHTEWTGDLKVIKDFLQIEDEVIKRISKFNQGEFYFSGEFIEEDEFAKVGMVKTTHTGETPDMIPPTTKQIKSVIEKLKTSLPRIVEEKIKPSIVDTKKVEEKIKSRFEKEHKGKIIRLETEIESLNKQQISEEEIQKRIDETTNEQLEKNQELEIEINHLKKFIASIISKGNQFLGEQKEEFVQETRQPLETDYNVWLNKFKGGKRTILEVMIKHPKLTRDQLVIMSGLGKQTIAKNMLPTLKRAGLVRYDSDNIELTGG